jgi:DNA-binding transcriptional ArsR family regulator
MANVVALALDALGDPTRRRVLELLHGGERTVRELTDALPVSQPAVSQHLRVLREAGLVTARPEGARRIYRVDLDGLAEVRAYVDSFWDDVLTAFVRHAETAVGADPAASTSSSVTTDIADTANASAATDSVAPTTEEDR